jgi:hypothetical protein
MIFMNRFLLSSILLVRTAAACFVSACSNSSQQTDSGSDAGNDASLSFGTNVYGPIITSYCTFCHGLTGDGGPGIGIQFGHLDMSTESNAYANLVGDGGGVLAAGSGCGKLGADAGLLRVLPGDPTDSLIYNKVVSNDGDGGSVILSDGGAEVFCGHPMPEFEPSLPASDLAAIHDWIAQGAKP